MAGIAPRTLILASLVAAFLAAPHAAADNRLDARTDDATVSFVLPDALAVGAPHPLKVSVVPDEGKPGPTAVRARLGMPDHGHWVTGEGARDFRPGATLEYPGDFPMPGVYRLRVWLDYPDGRDAKAAVDFTVADGRPLAPAEVK